MFEVGSETKEFGEFDNEGSVFEKGVVAAEFGIPLIVVHHEKFTSRLIFPPEADVRAQDIAGGVVLEEASDKHPGCEGVGESRGGQLCGELSLGKLDAVERYTRFERKLRGDYKAAT